MIQPLPVNLLVNGNRTTVLYGCPKCRMLIIDSKSEKQCSNCNEKFDWSNLKTKTTVEFANKYHQETYRLPQHIRSSLLLAEVLNK